MNDKTPDVGEYSPYVTPTGKIWPGKTTLRRMAHHRLRHRDTLPWRKLRLHWAMFRRGVHMRYALDGNVLDMLRDGSLVIGRDCIFDGRITVRGNAGARILLGEGVGMNRNVTVGAEQLVVIGDHTIIGQGSYITDADHVVSDPDKPSLEQGMRVKGPTIIEDHVWLGMNVFVGSGVRIGRGSLVGANSVVTKDVPPYSIVYGVAAKAHPRPDLLHLHPAGGDGAAAPAAAGPAAPAPREELPTPVRLRR